MQVNISKKTVIILVAAFLATGLVTTLVGVFQEAAKNAALRAY